MGCAALLFICQQPIFKSIYLYYVLFYGDIQGDREVLLGIIIIKFF
jgi:hypothetical protein